MITIREQSLNIDVLEELNYFDWQRARNRGTELTACSPFRNEASPSFSINLETGQWIDFGSADFFSKGSLVTLLSFLRNETPGEIEEYLLSKYGLDLSDVDSLKISFNPTQEKESARIITLEEYSQYAFRSSYLEGRGISEKVQRAFKIGYDKNSKAVAIPWFNIKGEIINVKFRSVKSKIFFYYPEGQPLRNHIYGIHFIYKLRPQKVFIVESEIDALYLWTHGYAAIAIGGSKLSKARRQLLLRCPVETFVIATDNDAVGREVKEKLVNALVGYKELHEITLPEQCKDVNDLTPEQLKQVADSTTSVKMKLF